MNKYKPLARQFIKYFGVALVGYVFDFGLLILLTSVFHVYYLIGATVGFLVGLVVTYFLSNRYVFGESKVSSQALEFTAFAVIGLIGLALLNGLMWLMVSVAGISYILSKIIATVFVYAWNFFARRGLYHN